MVRNRYERKKAAVKGRNTRRMRRQLCRWVVPDCCEIDRLAGADQAGAAANGSVMGSVILILGLTTAPSWRRADISFCALVVGRCDRFASRRPRPGARVGEWWGLRAGDFQHGASREHGSARRWGPG